MDAIAKTCRIRGRQETHTAFEYEGHERIYHAGDLRGAHGIILKFILKN
jgi:hypothetical protein